MRVQYYLGTFPAVNSSALIGETAWCSHACYCVFIASLSGEEMHEMVEVFCDNMDSSVTLPDIGTWVAVRVTAVFNPGHFWVQFPYGTEPIEKRIMAGML